MIQTPIPLDPDGAKIIIQLLLIDGHKYLISLFIYLIKMKLPDRLFFTGVPGSRWSGIAQTLESLPGFNATDRTPDREYTHQQFGGHRGAYFGPGMEFVPSLDSDYIDMAHAEHWGTRVIKSHEWAYQLPDIQQKFPDDWIMLVYRPDMASYAWWHQAGGFTIKYPDYQLYVNSENMLGEIARQNRAILEFACACDATWSYFTADWCELNFGHRPDDITTHPDILVTVIHNTK